jgi:hypothetical protein
MSQPAEGRGRDHPKSSDEARFLIHGAVAGYVKTGNYVRRRDYPHPEKKEDGRRSVRHGTTPRERLLSGDQGSHNRDAEGEEACAAPCEQIAGGEDERCEPCPSSRHAGIQRHRRRDRCEHHRSHHHNPHAEEPAEGAEISPRRPDGRCRRSALRPSRCRTARRPRSRTRSRPTSTPVAEPLLLNLETCTLDGGSHAAGGREPREGVGKGGDPAPWESRNGEDWGSMNSIHSGPRPSPDCAPDRAGAALDRRDPDRGFMSRIAWAADPVPRGE